MFERVLIANRGEIACRIIRTCRRLGIRSVAVFSEADRDALFVEQADLALPIGPAAPAESYLRIDRIIDAARQSGAQAIHPGYGFLAENAELASACAEAGVTFVGPPPGAISAMGSKRAAKGLMEAAGVPVVPGYFGESQGADWLAQKASRIGFPLLIKASAGGGGKGMRRVDAQEAFAEALASARREAQKAFGDDQVLLERFVERPRHIEVQVVCDSQGAAIHLHERECSIQRRYQKVIEEAPAPGLDADLRRRIGEAAVEAARAIGYVNAGTVEFILAPDGAFYFMEMNTRLQVEHPVTELVTGIDLVAWQLAIACGEPLPMTQAEVPLQGHAIEARIYAEDPRRGFLPATGRLQHLVWPATSPHVRIDTGVRQGDRVTIDYDPMLAKLAVWDEDRPSAVARLRTALAECQIAGLATNLPFLAAVAGHPAYAAADVDTGFIERHQDALVPEDRPAEPRMLALAALAVLGEQTEAARASAPAAEPWSPWCHAHGWRLNQPARQRLELVDGEREVVLLAEHRGGGAYALTLDDGRTVEVEGRRDGPTRLAASIDGVRLTATVVRVEDELTLRAFGHLHTLRHRPLLSAAGGDDAAAGGQLVAPMPGKLIGVLVAVGDEVERGRPLVILEAMKMEQTIVAPADGTVESLPYAEGDQVEEGVVLVGFAAKEPA